MSRAASPTHLNATRKGDPSRSGADDPHEHVTSTVAIGPLDVTCSECPAAAAGCAHAQHVARRARSTDTLSASLIAPRLVTVGEQPVLADRAWCTAMCAPRCAGASLGDERHHCVLEHLELALDAVATGMLTRATGPRSQGVPAHTHRKLAFERLDRGVRGVRHPGVHSVHARGPRPATLATTERLVVHPSGRATGRSDGHVVHRSLARGPEPVGRGDRERAQAHVGDALADLDVAGADRDRRHGRDHGARGATTRTGRSAPPFAGIVGSVAARSENATAATVTASTALTFPACCIPVPLKSKVARVVADRQRDDDRDRVLLLATRAGGVERVLEPVRAVRQRRERGTHPAFAVVDDLVERAASHRAPR